MYDLDDLEANRTLNIHYNRAYQAYMKVRRLEGPLVSRIRYTIAIAVIPVMLVIILTSGWPVEVIHRFVQTVTSGALILNYAISVCAQYQKSRLIDRIRGHIAAGLSEMEDRTIRPSDVVIRGEREMVRGGIALAVFEAAFTALFVYGIWLS